MSQIRCLICGSSQWDSKGVGCGRCGGAMGMRQERCHVNEETKKKLFDHADELAKFGINLEQRDSLQKNEGAIATLGLIIACADSFHHGVLRQLVLYLRDNLVIPEDEILKLRLDEPEQIVTYCRVDKKN